MNDSDLDASFNFIMTIVVIIVVTGVFVFVGYIIRDFGFRSGYCAALDGERAGSVCLLPDGTFEEIYND